MKNIVIVIPTRNEALSIESNLQKIYQCVKKIDFVKFSFLIVDDGSDDRTIDLVSNFRHAEKIEVNLICLRRHFGKEAAILAGLEHSRNFDAAIVMDSDLQHPPKLIEDMIKQWQCGFLVVEGVKSSRGNESLLKSISVRYFYRAFKSFSGLSMEGESDFKLLDSVVVDSYCELTETSRFFRGLISWLNYPTKKIPFDVPESTRPNSSWNAINLFRYAISSITSFTSLPLQIVTLLGAITFVLSVIAGGKALFDKILGNAVDGFTTVILLILIIGSILMFSIGVIGIYIGKIYDEVKSRPKYLINKDKNTVRNIKDIKL